MTSIPTTAELLAETRWLEQLARRLTNDPEDADDLVHDTLLTALRRAPAAVHPRAWLATVARRLWWRRRQREAHRAEAERAAARPEAEPSTSELVEKALVHRQVVDALVTLDEPYRRTLLLRYLQDLPLCEVARRTGVPAETARTRVKRGIAVLRTRLDRRFGGRAAWALPLGRTLASPVPATLLGSLCMSLNLKIAGAVGVLAAAVLVWQLTSPTEPSPSRVEPSTQRPQPQVVDAGAPLPAPPAARAALPPTNGAATAIPPLAIATGTVVDEESHRPIGGAAVSWAEVFPEGGRHRSSETAISDADGRFELPTTVADAWRHLEVVVAAADRATIEQKLTPPEITEPLARLDLGEIPVPPGTGVRGRVVDTSGAPVAQATLLMVRHWIFVPTASGLSKRVPRLSLARAAGVTDAAGAFTLSERFLPRRRDEMLLAVAAGGLGWCPVQLSRARREIDVEITLQPTAMLTVEVVDGRDRPLAGADVTCEPRFLPLGADYDGDLAFGEHAALRRLFVATTDAAGRATFAHLPRPDEGAPYSVRVSRNGAELRHRGLELGGTTSERLRLVLSDTEAWTVRGQVRDPSGTPIAGARVAVAFGTRLTTTTGADGRFAFDALPGADHVDIEASADGFTRVTSDRRPPTDSREIELELVLEPAAAIAGVVVDQDGLPFAGARVTQGRDPSLSTRTDAAGHFALGPVALHQLHELWFDHDDARHVDHFAETTDSPLTVVLPRQPRGVAHLQVEVTDAAGRPLDPGTVRLIRLADNPLRLAHPATGRIGIVTAADLAAGDWLLLLQPPVGAPIEHHLQIAPDDRDVRTAVRQSPAARVDGEVVVEAVDGRSPDRVTLYFVGDHEPRFATADGTPVPNQNQTTTVDLSQDPHFTVTDVDPTRDLVVEIDDDGWAGRVRLRAEPGRSTPARLVVRPAAQLDLRSVRPWPGSTLILHLRAADGAWREPLHFGAAHGKTAFFSWSLPSGAWDWRVELPTQGRSNDGGARWLEGSVSVEPGESRTLLLDPDAAR